MHMITHTKYCKENKRPIITGYIKGTSYQGEKDKHSTGTLGKGHEQEIPKSNESSHKRNCVLSNSLANSKRFPGSRYGAFTYFTPLSHLHTLHTLSHLFLTTTP